MGLTKKEQKISADVSKVIRTRCRVLAIDENARIMWAVLVGAMSALYPLDCAAENREEDRNKCQKKPRKSRGEN